MGESNAQAEAASVVPAVALQVFDHPGTLRGSTLRLEPLSHDHHDGLVDAVRDGELWRLGYTRIPSPEGMGAEIERRLALQGSARMLPFTILRADGQVLGMTTFMNLRPEARRLEIGSTWFRASAQGTGVNPEAKLLMLRHAFEEYRCLAVEIRTSHRNAQSRAAIAKLGARQDGILRQHDIMPDGHVRDVVVFSIIASEWPDVKRGLEERLGR